MTHSAQIRLFFQSQLFLFSFLFLAVAQAAEIVNFSPSGEVKGVRQVTARFSSAMVPFGDPRELSPFTISCDPTDVQQGTGRWADTRNWVVDFGQDLPAGVRCDFKIKPNLKALKGDSITGTQDFSFTTGGPAIVQTEPYEGSVIAEDQVFLIALDTAATVGSIEKNVYFDIEGVNEKVGVTVLPHKERDVLLKEHRYFLSEHFSRLYPGENFFATVEKGKNNPRDKFLKQLAAENSSLFALQCKRALPNKKQVRLMWSKGVSSVSGIANRADQPIAFETRETFNARLNCERVNAKSDCIPLLPITLSFSASIATAAAKTVMLIGADGKRYSPEVKSHEGEPQDWISELKFVGPFPEKAQFNLEIPAGLKDDAGRELANRERFPLTVKTDEYPPLAKFAANFGIIEAKGDRVLPVTVRNIEDKISLKAATVPGKTMHVGSIGAEQKIIALLSRLRYMENKENTSFFSGAEQTKAILLPKPGGKKEFEVIGIPLKEPGFHVVEIASPRLGAALLQKQKPYYARSAALVTNLGVHFKWGVASSLVWVTSLDQAKPVAQADVTVRDCQGHVHWQGKTDKDGIARISDHLPRDETLPSCDYLGRILIVFTRAGDDLAFAQSDWNEGIATWRFNINTDFSNEREAVHTIFARTLLRAGETVHMKHLRRTRSAQGFDIPRADTGDGKLIIAHMGTEQKFEVPVKWDESGIAESTWTIPKEAKQGQYSVMVGERYAGSFRVEAFRVPTMRAIVKPLVTPLVNASKADLDIQLNYLAGGGVAGAKVRLNSLLEPRSVYFPDYNDYRFAAGNVKEGVEKAARDNAMTDEGELPTPSGNDKVQPLGSENLVLDGQGAARTTIAKLPKIETPKDILTELEYRDANGEISTVATRVPLWPAKLLLGLKPDSWAISKDKLKFYALAVDVNGKPMKDVAIMVDLLHRKTLSHRKRLVGGFYAYENVNEVKRIAAACQGSTDAKGLLICETKSPISGNIILRAEAKDDTGNIAYTNTDVWVAGSEDWWFTQSNDDRMDLLPEKKRYEPNETATLQARMPFRQATALVSVEREGVLESFVTELSGKSPVVKVPLKGGYAPNVFVSVLVVRGRVGDVQPTALVDLGKPAFKLGLAEIKVGWREHELKVKVDPEKTVYKVRDQAKIRVHAERADGKPLPKGAEIALAAVDEGLLELMPNASWNLLDAMMHERGLGVETATAQMQVVGRRHYGRKALATGGGGGAAAGQATAREMFDTLLFWKGRITLDEKGNATISVPLNDSLTSFRIVAIANADAGLFGTGAATIRATQDLMLFSGMPPLVREQDQFHAAVTLRNATEQKQSVIVKATVTASNQGTLGKSLELATRDITIKPGNAEEVTWLTATPINADQLLWDVTVNGTSGGNPIADHIKFTQQVAPAIKVRTLQATLLQLDKAMDIDVALPKDAVPNRGGIKIDLSRSLADQLRGVRDYMRDYRYSCLEQRVSKAIALNDDGLWTSIDQALPGYLDQDGLAKYFTDMRSGSDVLTAYVLSIADASEHPLPDAAKARMQEGLRNFIQGKINRDSSLPTADLALRKLAAFAALSRSDPAPDPTWLTSISIEPNLWPTSAVLDWLDILQRVQAMPDRDLKLKETEQILRSRLNFQGTLMGFSTERSDNLWWLMVSGDSNANRAVLSLLDQPAWREDLPRMARGAIQRQHRGHWNTTIANAWGALALRKFSQVFEAVPVAGSTSASLAQNQQAFNWQSNTLAGTLNLPWPPSATDKLALQHQGNGKPWVTVSSRAAVPLKAPLMSGFTIARTVTAIEQQETGKWNRGDVLRVRLDLDAQTDVTWVVVDDPIPAGATILGSGLGRDSQIMTQGEKREGWVWPSFEEHAHDAFRAYYDYVPKGKWSFEYTLRLNTAGDFRLPETRVEAMYAPEMFAELPNSTLAIQASEEMSFLTKAKRWLDTLWK
ncbi:MAG: MG2 domain-containing protein [Burkholderiales bacterium]